MWDGIWVNDKAQRFINEVLNPRDALAAVLSQPKQFYWGVMDDIGKRSFYVRGTGWDNQTKVDQMILNNPELAKKAGTWRELAEMTRLPAGSLELTVHRWNTLVEQGDDLDFGRFGPRRPDPLLLASWANAKSRRLEQPPFYAIRMYPIARKSLGGLRIDHQCRVLNDASEPIRGLYAVGEVSGFGGKNGSAGLEGTFIGPSVLQGALSASCYPLADRSLPLWIERQYRNLLIRRPVLDVILSIGLQRGTIAAMSIRRSHTP
jgi:succinate dehydrogenase/fumarate reductase flavoprotein subunit